MQYGGIGTFWPLETYFATWVIFWSERIETSLNKNCVMFCLKYLNQFSIKTCLVQNMTEIAKYVPRGQNISLVP